MNMKNNNYQCHCEPIALSGAVGAVEAGRSNLLFNKKIDLLRGDCFIATNAPRNDMNVREALL